MKILINTPSLDLLGGVANHYLGLKPYWKENVKYNAIGKRFNISGLTLLLWDIAKLTTKLLLFKPDVMLVNPSIGLNALRRDFIFLNLAHLCGCKTAVFIHGFNLDVAEKINHDWVARNLNKTSLIFVLADSFEKILIDWGVKTPIKVTTTKVDDRLLKGMTNFQPKTKINNLLFLARIEKAKGIYIAIDSFKILKEKYPELELTIVGGGSELEAVKDRIEEEKLDDISVTGALSGDALIDQFLKADCYILPTHGEGMPTSVLEAMAFGLPIVTRKVGGLADFFENGKMGYITDSLNPQVFADAIEKLIEAPDLVRNISKYNHEYAINNFMASNVARKIESDLKTVIERNCHEFGK